MIVAWALSPTRARGSPTIGTIAFVVRASRDARLRWRPNASLRPGGVSCRPGGQQAAGGVEAEASTARNQFCLGRREQSGEPLPIPGVAEASDEGGADIVGDSRVAGRPAFMGAALLMATHWRTCKALNSGLSLGPRETCSSPNAGRAIAARDKLADTSPFTNDELRSGRRKPRGRVLLQAWRGPKEQWAARGRVGDEPEVSLGPIRRSSRKGDGRCLRCRGVGCLG